MKITVVYGQNHKGSTYRIARMLAEKLDGDISEIFLPRDFGEFCVGCAKCILHDAKDCPHAESLQPITQKLDEADVIILASPVYVYHVTGSGWYIDRKAPCSASRRFALRRRRVRA